MVHRQVRSAVGSSNIGNAAGVRCHACGALSQAKDVDLEGAHRSSVGAELEAILLISQALTELEDDQRQRVLHWAAERFRMPAAADSMAPAVAAPDLTLRVEDLDDLFGAPELDEGHESGPSVDEELGDLFDETTTAAESPVDVTAIAAADEQRLPIQSGEAPLDVLVADFVSEFRRLAVECQGS